MTPATLARVHAKQSEQRALASQRGIEAAMSHKGAERADRSP
jgi:hypothetical protein